ncbi:sulfatase-like hydrolase/transferase [Cognatishimia sp. SS12]|uniref:sulfatase-like hydrolase/transferase n=1 Tax=Cognatishimia sp. SS12 TaxID=2979465 RepID=UPI00232FF6A9|nr:sulfatase-like hydrolase/transferase [Cognatishimia sp. SS12]MDC0739601.1 sulfatase-like hydrolase/transferase [Cognatishimia sp. SS12]
MKKQNIILFLTDQWRWDTLNQPGNPAKLPNLQAFKQEATNFTNAFTSVPLCTPARGSLFTGKLPHQNGTMDNVSGGSFYPEGKLHPSHPTYMERLMAAGYDVSFIGKWHLGKGTLIDRGITDAPLSDGGDNALVASVDDLEFAEDRLNPFYGTVLDGIPADEQRAMIGIERLERYAKSDKPFCLIVSLHGPHFPHNVPQKWVDLYDDLPEDYMPDNYIPQFTETDKPHAQSAHYWPCQDTRGLTQQDWRKTAQHYWGFCSYIDDMFGQFWRKMKDLGLDQTSVLGFTADHGEMLGSHGWFDKGPFFYEEVMRIPMFMHTPNGKAGEVRDNYVSFRDVFPALLDQAGVGDLLSDEEQARSFWKSDADHITYGYDAYQGRQFKFRGIRNDRYKYAWSPHDIEELYDLETDPGERINLHQSAEHAAIKADLKDQLFDQMRAEEDALAYPGYQLPVGSYIDGRPHEEQHIHQKPK